MARQGYGRHVKVVAVADDGSSPVGTDEWNADVNSYGILGFTSLEETISGGIVTLTASAVNQQSSILRIDGEGDANDVLNQIAISETNEYDLLYLFEENSGRTISVQHAHSGTSTGKIYLLAGSGTKDLSATVPMIIIRKGDQWYEYGGSGTSGAGDLTGTTLASNVVNSSLVNLGLSAAGVVKTATNGNISAGTIGIADDNIVEVDDADAADNDYAKFTANGLEGRQYSEVLSDIGAQAALTFGIGDGNVAKCNDAVVDNDFLKIDGTEIEGRTAAQVLTDIAGVSTALTSARLYVGNGSNVATGVDVTGDVTISNAGVTAIGAVKVTNAMLEGSIVNGKLSTNPLLYPNMTAPSAAVAFNNQKLTGLADGVADTDAATKGQVDVAQRGLDAKDSCRVATTANGTLASAFANGQTVDGISLATGNRILIKDQSTATENGIYTVNSSGAPTRATDADASAEVTSGMYTWVEEGTSNLDKGFVLTTNDPITVGSTNLAFSQFSGLGQITAGTAITKVGDTLNVDVGIANNEVAQFNATPADDDFLRIDGTKVEGLNAGEVLTAIGASPTAGNSSLVTVGALTTGGSIATGFGNIDNGSSTINTGVLSATQLNTEAQGELRLQDAAGGEYVGFKAPTTATSYTLTMPAATTSTTGYVLKMSASANVLEWGAAGGGAHTEQEWTVYTTHTPTAAVSDTSAFMFTRKIDTNNDGLYIQLWKNAASTTIQIA